MASLSPTRCWHGTTTVSTRRLRAKEAMPSSKNGATLFLLLPAGLTRRSSLATGSSTSYQKPNMTAFYDDRMASPRHGIKRHDCGRSYPAPLSRRVFQGGTGDLSGKPGDKMDGKAVRSKLEQGWPASLLPLDSSGDDAWANTGLNSDAQRMTWAWMSLRRKVVLWHVGLACWGYGVVNDVVDVTEVGWGVVSAPRDGSNEEASGRAGQLLWICT